MLILELSLILFCACGYEDIPFGEDTNYAGSDFLMGNCFIVFAKNVDPEFLSSCEAGDG